MSVLSGIPSYSLSSCFPRLKPDEIEPFGSCPECTLVMMPLDSSKPFLIDIVLKGNSVRFQGLEGTSLLTSICNEVAIQKECNVATRRERESNRRKPTLRSHCSSHCSSHWCSHCRKPTVVKPYSLPVHMALAINGCPSPSSVLTSFLISLSNVHSCGIPSAVFPVRQHQHLLSRIRINIRSAGSGSASASAQQNQDQHLLSRIRISSFPCSAVSGGSFLGPIHHVVCCTRLKDHIRCLSPASCD